MTNFRKFLLVFFVIVIVFFSLTFSFLYYADYSEGTRGGVVAKLSKKGILFKTHEGQLNVGAGSGTIVGSNLWDFSVDDDDAEVIKTLDDAMLTGKRVKLYYEEKFYRLFWRGDTKYFITKVEVLQQQ